jgi:hypothetical protein
MNSAEIAEELEIAIYAKEFSSLRADLQDEKIAITKGIAFEKLFDVPIDHTAIKCGILEKIKEDDLQLTISLFDSLYNCVEIPVKVTSQKQEFLFSAKEQSKNKLVNLRKYIIRSETDCEFFLTIVKKDGDMIFE